MPKRENNSYAKCGIDGNESSQSKSKFYRTKQYKLSRNRFEKRFCKRAKYKSQQNSNLDLASIQTKMLSSWADLFDDELKSNCCLACTEAFVSPAPAASEFFMTYCGFNICFNKTLDLQECRTFLS